MRELTSTMFSWMMKGHKQNLKNSKIEGIGMGEFDYLEELDNDALVKIIAELLDFEEVTEALMILEDRDRENAFVLGEEIIRENKGDDYLQATVWNVLFYDNELQMLEAVDRRTDIIGKTLLDEIIIDLTNNKIEVRKNLLMKIKNTYLSISVDDRQCMNCDYDGFVKMYYD